MVSANVSIADSKVRSSSMTKPWGKPQVIMNYAIMHKEDHRKSTEWHKNIKSLSVAKLLFDALIRT